MSGYIMNRESLKRHCEETCKRFKDVPTSGAYREHRLVLDLLEQTEWIPVTERLPEEGRFVLLCFKKGITCPHFRYQVGYLRPHDVEDNYFVKTGEKQVWYTNNFYYDFYEVIAWMPFPDYEE